MAKYHCTVCGYVFDEEKEGISIEQLPRCPACKFPREKFVLFNGDEEELEEEIEEAEVYVPHPIYVSEVALSAEVYELAETLAANAHETWAKERMDEGWEYGELEDTMRKITPLLLPYRDLSPENQESERTAILQTLKAIRALGYRIVKEEPVPEESEELPAVCGEPTELSEELAAIEAEASAKAQETPAVEEELPAVEEEELPASEEEAPKEA